MIACCCHASWCMDISQLVNLLAIKELSCVIEYNWQLGQKCTYRLYKRSIYWLCDVSCNDVMDDEKPRRQLITIKYLWLNYMVLLLHAFCDFNFKYTLESTTGKTRSIVRRAQKISKHGAIVATCFSRIQNLKLKDRVFFKLEWKNFL